MRNTKYYADQNLNRAHFDKCKRTDNAIKLALVIGLLTLFIHLFITNFPK